MTNQQSAISNFLAMPKPTTTFIDVAGKKTQLTIGGEGPPLVYLHSAGGETDWMPFHNRLAKSFTVYAPAHPGFALSEGLDEIRDIYDYAWHYVDMFEQLGLKGAPVVGFSLGAWIATELAILRPQLVDFLKRQHVAAFFNHLQLGLGNLIGVILTAGQRNEFVIPAPQHQRGTLHPPQMLRQPRIVQVWIPTDAGRRFASP